MSRGMRSGYGMLALMMYAAAMGDPRVYGASRREPKPIRKKLEPMTPEREKKILADMDSRLHDFNINGEIIRAKDKKTAKKIYSNRHKHG